MGHLKGQHPNFSPLSSSLDIDKRKRHPCDPRATCNNTLGNYSSFCPPDSVLISARDPSASHRTVCKSKGVGQGLREDLGLSLSGGNTCTAPGALGCPQPSGAGAPSPPPASEMWEMGGLGRLRGYSGTLGSKGGEGSSLAGTQ